MQPNDIYEITFDYILTNKKNELFLFALTFIKNNPKDVNINP